MGTKILWRDMIYLSNFGIDKLLGFQFNFPSRSSFQVAFFGFTDATIATLILERIGDKIHVKVFSDISTVFKARICVSGKVTILAFCSRLGPKWRIE